jgi:processing peptidase subunit beta
MRLCTSVSEAEVFRAKNQLKTSMLLSLDGTTPVAEDIGRQILNYGKRLNPWETDALIEQVSVSDVMRVAQQYIYDNDIAVVGYGPVESLQDYNRMRANMTKLAVSFTCFFLVWTLLTFCSFTLSRIVLDGCVALGKNKTKKYLMILYVSCPCV